MYSMSSREEEFFKTISDVGMAFIIRETFLGYKYRKHRKKLYSSDLEIPKKLITIYYGLNPDQSSFDTLKKAFINRYIKNESDLEEVDCSQIHGEIERRGLGNMYEFIHSEKINVGGVPPFSFKYRDIFESQIGRFNVWSLQDLHRELFSLAPCPDEAGKFRNYSVFLPGTGTNILPWDMINETLMDLNQVVDELHALAGEILISREGGVNFDDVNKIFDYIEKCIKLKCALIKVHPFSDGNGRVIRGFVNKLFEDINLPPVYIKPSERTEYQTAMNKANNDNDYSDIVGFYLYKICDSIIELDPRFELRKNDDKVNKKSKH